MFAISKYRSEFCQYVVICHYIDIQIKVKCDIMCHQETIGSDLSQGLF